MKGNQEKWQETVDTVVNNIFKEDAGPSVENVIISLLRVCQNHARQVYKQNDDDEFEHLNIYILSMQYVCKWLSQ